MDYKRKEVSTEEGDLEREGSIPIRSEEVTIEREVKAGRGRWIIRRSKSERELRCDGTRTDETLLRKREKTEFSTETIESTTAFSDF